MPWETSRVTVRQDAGDVHRGYFHVDVYQSSGFAGADDKGFAVRELVEARVVDAQDADLAFHAGEKRSGVKIAD